MSNILIYSLFVYCLPVALSAQTAYLSATSLQFGDENVGTKSASQSVLLTNTGDALLNITSISLTGADTSSFVFTNGCGMNLAARRTCSIHVHFMPATDGAQAAEVAIIDNASDSPESIGLSGTGTGAPVVSLSTNSLMFAGRKIGTTSASQSVLLTNTGDAPLDITSISLTGADTSSFVFTNGCGLKLAAGKVCSIHGQFKPAAAGSLTAAVTITDNAGDSPETIALSGTGAGTTDTLSVASSKSPSTFGGSVTFTATISSGPTGTITFLDGGATIGAGTINGATAAITTSTLAAGSHSITATWPGNSNYSASASSPIVQEVNPAVPVVTWNAAATIAYGTPLSAIELDATSTLPGTFAYTPAAGTVLKAGAQTLSVIFSPADSTDYSAVSATVPLAVNKVTPVLSWTAPAAISYGTPLGATQLDASSTVAGSFAYSPAAGAVLTAGAHLVTATFTPTDLTDYTTATATVTLAVTTGTPAVMWAAPAGINYGTALSATQLNASSTVPGTFAYIPAAGTVLKAGSQVLSVTFNPSDSTDYAPATATVNLVIAALAPAITWASPAAISYGTPLGVAQFDASSTVAGNFSYAPAVGTVLKAGSQVLSVTFTPADSTDYTSANATVSLTVTAIAPTLTWASPASIGYGTALSGTQLDVTSTVPGTFTYTPASGSVLKVGSQSLLAMFTPTDSTDYTTASSSVSITVNQATPVISWAVPSAIGYGTALSTAQLNATSTVAGTFAYSPAAGAVLMVGSHTILTTFLPTDTTDYTTATATVTLAVNQAASVVTWAAPAAIVYGTALSTTQLNASSTVAGSFAYSPAAGALLTAGSQTLTVSFTPTDTVDYASAASTTLLTVNKAVSTITWVAPAAITYGTSLSAVQLDASSTVAGAFAYTPVAGTVLTAGTRTLSVTFSPADAVDYTPVTSNAALTVNQAVPQISWPAPTAITYGLALSATQLDATSNTAGTFSYSPAAGTILTAGGHTVTASFTPTDTTDYTGATAMAALTINQAMPVVTWASPAAIPSGTALSNAQLDATSMIPGVFAYSPVAGTVLAVGSQTLSVTFTPSDSTDYETATTAVSLTVIAGTSTLNINATSVGFGNVDLNTPATQIVILSSTGTGPVTVNSAVVAGPGFTLSGPTFPATLTTGQTATLGVEFDPTILGAATGTLTVTSTSTTNGTAVIALTGTGIAVSYAVELSWDAPTSSTDPVAGYNVYRSPSGSSAYALLNSSADDLTTYLDSTVLDGTAYDYIVESVDASGVESVPTSPIAMLIP